MNKFNNRDNNLSDIQIGNLELENLDSYIKIEFEAFFEKLKFIFSNREKAAFNIIRSEISENIGTKRYYNARSEEKTVGIIEIVTRENIRGYKRNFQTYIKYLGFLKAVKAFFINFIETPKLGSKTIYIDNVAVDINNRRKGIASKMLSFVEDFARKNGKSTLKLWVASKNRKAYNLYKKFGFTELVKRSSRISEKYIGYRDWIYMRKEIL